MAVASPSGRWSRWSGRQLSIDDEDPPERANAKLLGLLGDQEVAQRIASAIGLSDASFPLAEVFWAVGRLAEVLADRSAVVLVFDDIHWAESTLLDLIAAPGGRGPAAARPGGVHRSA